MRIVAGTFKGRVIDSPSERTTRPTTDRVRESMFSALYSRIDGFEGVHVLDAFAGSGALGIEALSRGAASCTFFERDRTARRILSDNISSLGLGAAAVAVRGSDVLAASRRSISDSRPFGLVLLDPPYALEAECVEELVEHLRENGDLADGAVIVYEHAHADSAEVEKRFRENAFFELTGMKKYGKIGVAFLKNAKS